MHQSHTSGPSFQYQQFEHKINRPTSVAPCNALSWRSHITHLGTSWRVRRQIRVENNSHQELSHSQLPQPSPAQPITLQCQQTAQTQRADHPRALIRDEKAKKQKLRFCNSTAVAEWTTSESHTTRTHDGEDVADNRIAAACVASPKPRCFFFFFSSSSFSSAEREKKEVPPVTTRLQMDVMNDKRKCKHQKQAPSLNKKSYDVFFGTEFVFEEGFEVRTI